MQGERIFLNFRQAGSQKRETRRESDVGIGEVGGFLDGDVKPIPPSANYRMQVVIFLVQVDVPPAVYMQVCEV